MTQLSLTRPITSYEKVRRGIAYIQRRRRSQACRIDVAAKSYLDLGCGPNPHEGFINLDYRWAPHIDVTWDITRGLPFPSESMDGIFTEHCLEHVPLACIPKLLRECYRVLRPSRTIRIIVPDAELYLRKYVANEPLPYSENDSFQSRYRPILSINRIFREHGHQFLYDYNFLSDLLEDGGFSDVTRAAFKSGRDPKLLIDTPHRAVEALYVEGVRK